MEKKYIMTNETRTLKNGTILHRIKAIKDFGDVKKGDLGGWIEKEENLSHNGNCWIYDNAVVCNNALVYGDACVFGGARVTDNARVHGGVWVYGAAHVFENARVSGGARVTDTARVFGNAWVWDSAMICGSAAVYEDAHISDTAAVSGNASVYGTANVCDDVRIYDNAAVFGRVTLRNGANIGLGASVSAATNYTVIGPIGSRNEWSTFYKNKDGGISVTCGCFNGTLEEFKEKVELSYGENGVMPTELYYTQYTSAINYAESVMMK